MRLHYHLTTSARSLDAALGNALAAGFTPVSAAVDNPGTAARIYGVIVRDGRLDPDATARERAGRAPPPPNGWTVTHGEARLSYEAVWPVDASAALASAVLGAPP